MIEPLVSVVMPVYNAAEYVGDAISSALSQTHKNIEILVVDDGSTDNSADIAEEFGGPVRCLRRKNGGPAAARNTGIESANGKYIAFLDADDLWLQDKLRQQVELLEKNPNVGLVHTASITFDESAEHESKDKGLPPLMTPGQAFRRLLSGNFISTSTVLVPRKLFQEFGVFDEDMKLFAVEDYDVWLRFAQKTSLAYIPTPLIKYRLHHEGISKNIDRSYTNERNVLKKWYASEQHLPIVARERFHKLHRDWAADLAWSNEHKKACNVLRESLAAHGFSFEVYKALMKYRLKSFVSSN